jgi:rhomboid family GlyGly-CTERM serine protease
MNRPPLITLGLCILACGLALLPVEMREALYFNYDQWGRGNWLGLVSGHWIHVDGQHLLWNVAALAVLGAMIEVRSRPLLLWSLFVGMAGVDLLLLSPLSDLMRYCGLSGLLNTLLGVALCELWRDTRSRMVITIGLFWVVKIALEMQSGQSLFTDISWPPFAPAHLAGALGTPVALLLGHNARGGRAGVNTNKGAAHGYVVASE